MLPYLADGDLDTAVLVGLGKVVEGTLKAPEPPGSIDLGPPPGPPFPEPEVDRAVYDHAGILSGDAIVKAEAIIDAIEARTGAEVVVYTQDSGEYPTTEETEAKARALMDQWGIGRAGFNDGLVIFFDMDPSLEHGQVQLYAGPGFEATYLSNQERQSIYENDMLPHLRSADFDAALAAALDQGGPGRERRSRRGPPARPPAQRGGRARRGTDRVHGPRRVGRPGTGAASARTRSTSTIRRS